MAKASSADELREIIQRIASLTPGDGRHSTRLAAVGAFRESRPHKLKPLLYDPFIIFLAQGRKRVVLDGKAYEYNPGNFLTVLAPMPMECQVLEASADKPLLGIGIHLDRQRLMNMVMKMDQVDPTPFSAEPVDPSGVFTAPLNAKLHNALLRLLESLESPADAALLGEAIIDEIHFRILKHERGGALMQLLQQRGQIQQIARAVEFLQQNLAEKVSIEQLAALVAMSTSAFHKKFKEVMHLSPLQYAKLVKLNRAQGHLLDGRSVSEAGYLVGYNSPAQFSREYKRHFGVAPSEERARS